MIKTFELLQYEIELPFICYHIKEGLVGVLFLDLGYPVEQSVSKDVVLTLRLNWKI